MSQEEFICVRCAREGKTCCQKTEVFTSLADVRRIREATGRDDFYEMQTADGGHYAPDQDADPVWARIFSPAGRRILKHRDNGDCLFLTDKGCALAMEIRPVVCRLYPFDYNHNSLLGIDPHFCPPVDRGNPAETLSMLCMNFAEAEAWRSRLYQDICEEFPD